MSAEDSKIREILGQSLPGSFQFCDSWERRREEVLAISLPNEPTFREVVYHNLPKGRRVRICSGSCELHQVQLADEEAEVNFQKATRGQQKAVAKRMLLLWCQAIGDNESDIFEKKWDLQEQQPQQPLLETPPKKRRGSNGEDWQ